jgi:predicted Zn finger-like uncharacterized protein
MNIYCPKCGEWFFVSKIKDIAPGLLVATCTECKTEWDIDISFVEAIRNP